VILLQKRAPGGLLSIKFRVIANWLECKFCGHIGDMKAYESEMERIAVKITKRALEVFGLLFEKKYSSQKSSRSSSEDVQALCEETDLTEVYANRIRLR
jgi:hypothetical protein